MSIWDDPELRTTSTYIRFDQPGDTVTGRITSIQARRWDDGSVSPELHLEADDGEVIVTAGQVRLKAALAEQRPEPGDTITITMTELEKRSGGKTLKHFDVTVDRGSKPSTKPATKPAPAPAAAAAPAASGYTAEQIEAMKILGIEPPA